MQVNGKQAHERVICLIDMDCFYVQVEELAAPQYRGKPCGVCQYNPYQGGGLIAVNYEARKFGVKRGMRGEQAKALCPDFHAFFVNEKRGKADLTKYREASLKIFEIITSHCSSVEKASIDEAYVDLTDKVLEIIHAGKMTNIEPSSDLLDSFVVGSFTLGSEAPDREANVRAWLSGFQDSLAYESPNAMLAVGAVLVQRMRQDILSKLGYHCSAGIAHNKTLAKLCCGLNKPNKQTILPLNSLDALYEATPIQKVKNLGGKLGVFLTEEMHLKTMQELGQLGQAELTDQFGEKTGNWLYQISHGIDLEPVMARQAAKSVGCSKNFRGNQALKTVTMVTHWITQLCEELDERLENERNVNNREPSVLVIHLANDAGSFSKQTALQKATVKRMVEQCLELIGPFNKSKGGRKDDWYPAINLLGVSTTKFKDLAEEKTVKGFLNKYFTNSAAATASATVLSREEAGGPKSDSSVTPCTSSALDDDPKSDDTWAGNGSFEAEESTSSRSPAPVTRKSKSPDKVIVIPDDESAAAATTSKDAAASKAPKKPEKKATKDSAAITKLSDFMAKTSAEAKSIYDDVDYVRCEKCSKRILCWEMSEHEDFHFAQELSKEFTTPAPAPVPAPTLVVSTGQKKRSVEAPGKPNSMPASKKAKPTGKTVTIDKFFQK